MAGKAGIWKFSTHHVHPLPLGDRAAASPPAVPAPPRRHGKSFRRGLSISVLPGAADDSLHPNLSVSARSPSPLSPIWPCISCTPLVLPRVWGLLAGLSPHGSPRAPCEAGSGDEPAPYLLHQLLLHECLVQAPPPRSLLSSKSSLPFAEVPETVSKATQSKTQLRQCVQFSVTSCTNQPSLLAWKFLKGRNRITSF